ncbi:MAG: hypothetical protein KAK04_09065 [Cyclobacteriaceae bacterium]|nr:hypothetical protein [Cyclobacteriaceae bacterium]
MCKIRPLPPGVTKEGGDFYFFGYWSSNKLQYSFYTRLFKFFSLLQDKIFHIIYDNHAISNTMVDHMSVLNDPKLPIYADPAIATNTILCIPYGVDNSIAGSITND